MTERQLDLSRAVVRYVLATISDRDLIGFVAVAGAGGGVYNPLQGGNSKDLAFLFFSCRRSSNPSVIYSHTHNIFYTVKLRLEASQEAYLPL